MRFAQLATACCLALGAQWAAAQEISHLTGTIVIQKLPDASAYISAGKEASDPTRYDDSTEARKKRIATSSDLKMFVQIDNGEKKVLDQHHDVTYKELDVTKKHLFKAYDASGKPRDSFYFSFENTQMIRLHYNPGYANWRMTN